MFFSATGIRGMSSGDKHASGVSWTGDMSSLMQPGIQFKQGGVYTTNWFELVSAIEVLHVLFLWCLSQNASSTRLNFNVTMANHNYCKQMVSRGTHWPGMVLNLLCGAEVFLISPKNLIKSSSLNRSPSWHTNAHKKRKSMKLHFKWLSLFLLFRGTNKFK